MTELLHWISWIPLLLGTAFFIAGTVGVLRFPDIFCRLHAVTKADTLGLGLIVLGLCMRATEWQAILVMLLVWLLIMLSGAVACQLLARFEQDINRSDPEDPDDERD